MPNKYHQEIQNKANMQRASDNAGVKFGSLGEVADYNKTLRDKAAKSKAEKKKYKPKPKKSKLPPRKGLPTGYDQ